MRTMYPLMLALLAGTLAVAQTCNTAPGAADSDGSVGAQAVFTAGDGTITVSLSNSLADPKSAGQLLSGLAFTLSTGQTSGNLASSAAVIRQVQQGGSFSDSGPSATGGALETNFSGGLFLCVLCTDLGAVGPSHLLIGNPNISSGLYQSANPSIAGNRPHNPFTAGTATFVLNVPGVTAGTTVTSATFFFSTQQGVSVAGSCGNTIPQ